MEKQKPPILQLSLLGLLLVVAPLGSYLYLKAGYDYRVESLSELGDLGAIDALGSSVALPANTVGVYYYADQLRANDSAAVSIKQVHEAFDDQPLVQFRGIGTADETVLKDVAQTKELGSDLALLTAFGDLTSRDPHCADIAIERRAVVTDTLGVVQRCYDLHNGQQVARLVEHLTILVPKPEEQDIFIERDREL